MSRWEERVEWSRVGVGRVTEGRAGKDKVA